MTSIYLAAPWANREAARLVRDELVAVGHTVTSRWLDSTVDNYTPDPDTSRREAFMDFDDIDDATLFLVLTDERPIGAGHHVELGWALAKGKHVVVVGPIKSIFHHLADRVFATWQDAREALAA